jgi:hypothetical protein
MLPNIRQITNIRHKAENIAKEVKFVYGMFFLGRQLQVLVDLWAAKTYSACIHKTLTMKLKVNFLKKKLA